MDKPIKFRQIILATDGESNVGCDPVTVAREAHAKGITISTVGIIDGTNKENPMVEVQNIALAGGGLWELTNIENLSNTMSMVTMRSVYRTIEEAVGKELREVLGAGLNQIKPDSRKKITDIVDKLGEEIDISCSIVIDCSGSMANKINIAKNSILTLLRILRSRKGKTEISVIGYPGNGDDLYQVLCNFTEDIVSLEQGLQKISIGGTTPTGPALQAAMKLLLEENISASEDIIDEEPIFRSNIV